MITTPLAALLRPNNISDIIGQEHLTKERMPLYQMSTKRLIKSSILWGPPGSGKTSIIRTLANDTDSNFEQLNATKSTVKDLRNVIDKANHDLEIGKNTIVFVDEIHRWNKSQQDIMLPVIEDGSLILFGATTEKPKFAINSTILSRCMVFEVKPLDYKSMVKLIKKVKDHYKTKGRNISIDKTAAKSLIIKCSGDARKLITALETVIEIIIDSDQIDIDHINLAIPDKHLIFDANGNEHFDLAHCYQQSIQNSDADAAVYWLAKWLESGEDPAYICRRMMITAFEDCSCNYDAISSAVAAAYAVERTGMPECSIPMSFATITMAKSKRNKSAYNAIKEAINDVRYGQTIHVPPNLRAGTDGYIPAITKRYVNGWDDVQDMDEDHEN